MGRRIIADELTTPLIAIGEELFPVRDGRGLANDSGPVVNWNGEEACRRKIPAGSRITQTSLVAERGSEKSSSGHRSSKHHSTLMADYANPGAKDEDSCHRLEPPKVSWSYSLDLPE